MAVCTPRSGPRHTWEPPAQCPGTPGLRSWDKPKSALVRVSVTDLDGDFCLCSRSCSPPLPERPVRTLPALPPRRGPMKPGWDAAQERQTLE